MIKREQNPPFCGYSSFQWRSRWHRTRHTLIQLYVLLVSLLASLHVSLLLNICVCLANGRTNSPTKWALFTNVALRGRLHCIHHTAKHLFRNKTSFIISRDIRSAQSSKMLSQYTQDLKRLSKFCMRFALNCSSGFNVIYGR